MLPRTHNPYSTAAAASSRRLSPNAPQICAALTAILLLLSLAVLHSRLSSSPFPISFPLPFHSSNSKLQSYPSLSDDPFADADNDSFDGSPDDDRIDAVDISDDDPDPDSDSDDDPQLSPEGNDSLFWDHSLAVFRRSFAKPVADPDPSSDAEIAFSSDDEPLGDEIRSKLHVVSRIEDILMVKTAAVSDNPLRNGWASWLEGKGDFLRRDRMLKSNLELLNPKNHPLLQDPDVGGASGYTRGDNLVHKSILREMEKVAFPGVEKESKIRRGLKLEEEEDSGRRRWGYFPGIDGGLSFSDFLERFFEAGKCGIRVFMIWNSPAWTFGVRHQRGLESLLKLHKDACVVVLSEMMEMDSFQSFVNDGYVKFLSLMIAQFL